MDLTLVFAALLSRSRISLEYLLLPPRFLFLFILYSVQLMFTWPLEPLFYKCNLCDSVHIYGRSHVHFHMEIHTSTEVHYCNQCDYHSFRKDSKVQTLMVVANTRVRSLTKFDSKAANIRVISLRN